MPQATLLSGGVYPERQKVKNIAQSDCSYILSPGSLGLNPMGADAHQARWQKCESTDAPITSQSIFLNSSAASLKAMISVGHTKVKSRG